MAAQRWVSFHAFLSDPERVARFLTEAAAPLAQGLVRERRAGRWFFLRYWEGGPHVRIRLQAPADDDLPRVRDALTVAAREWASPNPPTADEYYASQSFDGKAVERSSLPWYGEGALLEIPYEPETIRYGGPDALVVNERLFHASSDLAIATIRHTREDATRLMAIALSLMLATVLAHDSRPQVLLGFFATYARYWTSYSEATRRMGEADVPTSGGFAAALMAQIRAGRSTPAAAAPDRTPAGIWATAVQNALAQFARLWHDGRLISPISGRPVADAADYDRAVLAMLSSQVHMLNNRLGVVPAQEVFLARTLQGVAAALEDAPSPTPDFVAAASA